MTANQQWKIYRQTGGDLPFKEWVNVYNSSRRESYNATGSGSDATPPVTDSLQAELDALHRQGGYKDELSDEYILGIPKNIFIIVIISAVIAIGIVIYAHKKTNKA